MWNILLVFTIIFKITTSIVIELPKGKIEGLTNTTRNGTTYHSFLALRYAQPPIGKLRFKPPVPVEPWIDTYDGRAEKFICYQVKRDSYKENEDCLFLNVFTPVDLNSSFTANRTVMVWIHGGGFIAGAGYMIEGGAGPKFFMDQGIVLVSINYRLGPFGFLSTGDIVMPGNAGLKDQVLALKWVQDNIAYFGGDPDKVTIFGQSAGSASVSYQLLSPLSKGLYRGAILESGSALSPWAYQRNETEITFMTAQLINSSFTSRNTTEVLQFLQSASAIDIDNASFVVSASFDNPATAQISKGFVYAPVIEVPHEEAFLTEKQWGLFESGRYNKVPIFIGMNSEESMTLMHANSTETWDAYDNNPSIMVPYDLHINNTDIKKSIGWEIWNQFTDGEGFNNDLVKGIRYHSVHDFDKASIKQAELMSNHSDVYFYQFSYSGLMGYFGYRLAGCGNVSHAEELYYLFSKWYSNDIPDNTDMSYFPEADQKVHFRIMALWTNFAKYLNPTPPFVDVDLLQNVTWELVKPNEFRYLDIGKDLIMMTGYPKEKKYLFWDTLYKKYAVPPLDTF
ncbi:venom carboxylesterase-6-like [Anthonomus grandis grandis]|uniref:venom carboxylesterase-6-like n=1 Tax=Anthonomus grandis grandis TaxID=2921223 RepID=UPI00216600B3|nr:venom carboxylesterase-6-like [Anthonomus grandis grandis]